MQHEYGLYGGTDGDEILDILCSLTVPSIVVAHTVLLDPTEHQRQVLEAISKAASAVVVMAETARQRLCSRFNVDASKVTTIPHGATLASPDYRPDRSGRPALLTWGLLGPGKGIEWAIDAMMDLRALRPRPRYVVAGRTHPKVVSSEGEAYREMLVARTWAKGVAPSVTFDAAYRDLPSLTRLVQDATVVVLPYDSQDQVTSGVLVDALAAGRPVVATAFPHAVELLSSGAGIVVPHRDATALGAVLRHVLTEPGLGVSMARAKPLSRPRLRVAGRCPPVRRSRRPPHRRWPQPQPRSGVDIGLDLDVATRPPSGSVPPLTGDGAGPKHRVPGHAPASPRRRAGHHGRCSSPARRCTAATPAPHRWSNASWPWTTPTSRPRSLTS